MSKFDYVFIRTIQAAQWTGSNLEEMKELLQGSVESTEYIYADKIEAVLGYPAYNMLKFEAWGDDQEVDPGNYVVVYDKGSDGEIMSEAEFVSMYGKV